MKTLTIWQPWASLIAAGVKRYETRSWRTSHRGGLAIHAAARQPRKNDLALPGIVTAMLIAGLRDRTRWRLPLGSVLAIADLVRCDPTEDRIAHIDDRERRLGDWQPGRFAWEIDVIEVFSDPIPVRGQQGLWNWDGLEAT